MGTMPLLSATFTFDDHIRCMAAKQRLTKGRIKARQRKMHQIAKLLELPGNIGPACPSPPTSNLAALGYNSSDEFSQHSRSSSQSPRQGRRTTGGAYRPLFNTSSKVPGAAALLGSRERTAWGGGTSSYREQNQRRPASTSSRPTSALSSSGRPISANSGQGEAIPMEAIAMSRFDQRDSPDHAEDNSGDTPQDTFDETLFHNV